MSQTENVNGSAGQDDDDDEDFYDSASSLFPKVEHLAPSIPPKFGAGRLVAIWPTGKTGERKGSNGDMYPWVETVTLVLDNGPAGAEVNINPAYAEGSEEIVGLVGNDPIRLDAFQHSTGGLVARLQKRLKGVSPAKHDDAGNEIRPAVPLRWRPMIGRINTQASSTNKNVAAFSISDMTDGDRLIARKFATVIKALNAEMKARETEKEDSDAFDV